MATANVRAFIVWLLASIGGGMVARQDGVWFSGRAEGGTHGPLGFRVRAHGPPIKSSKRCCMKNDGWGVYPMIWAPPEKLVDKGPEEIRRAGLCGSEA